MKQALEVIIADSAGTCFGVDRAIEMAQEQRKPILGPLVHNPLVVEGLAEQGIPIWDRYQDVEMAQTDGVVITAHGYPKELKESLHDKGVAVHDATCPVLLNGVYRHIRRFDAAGRHVFLIGNPNHAEIVASRSYGEKVTVIYSDEDVAALPDGLGETVAMCQTTMTREKFEYFVAKIQERYPDVRVMDTRCRPVRNQQESVEELARWVDAMIIVGGYESSNTNNLAKIARRHLGQRVYHVDHPEKITMDMIAGAMSIGIGGGTSTPREQIEATRDKISELAGENVQFRMDRTRGGDPDVLPVDEAS